MDGSGIEKVASRNCSKDERDGRERRSTVASWQYSIWNVRVYKMNCMLAEDEEVAVTRRWEEKMTLA